MYIDYSRLNNRIVEQSIEAAGFTLSDAQLKRLFEDKVERAKMYVEAKATQPKFWVNA
jgi:hypothetical protein